MLIKLILIVSHLRPLIAGLKQRRTTFDPRPAHGTFVLDKIGTETGSPPSTSVAFHCQYHHTDDDRFMFTSLITAILANDGVVSLICNVDKLWGNNLTGTDEYWYRFFF